MAPQVATIATLKPSKSTYQITARATRIWEIKLNEDEQPVSLDMVLLDQEGNQIHATIPKKLVSSYKETLQEGKIYKLQHFEVAKNNRSYRPVTSTGHIIKCTPFTTIMEEDDQSHLIPQHKFEIHPLHILHERSNKIDFLIDVVGVLTSVEKMREVMTKTGKTLLRHVYIQDARTQPVRVTLWGNAADLINEAKVAATKDEVNTVVITSTKVVYYEGVDQLQSTYGTKIYLNLDIPEATNLAHSMDKQTPVKFIDNNSETDVEEPPNKSLTELQEMELPDEKQVFVCTGTITEIRTDVDWRYMSCTTCKSGIREDKTCFQCNKLVQYPIQRYRIMTTISDGEASAKLVIFDKEAEKVIGKPINKLLDTYEQENGKERVLDILQQCMGKQHTFKVKVGMSKFGYDRELKVQKTIILDEDKEDKTMINKGKEKATLHQEGLPQPPIDGVSSQTPEMKEKRKKPEKSRRGDKDIKVEGSSDGKRAKAQ